jgi:hypothetical protein
LASLRGNWAYLATFSGSRFGAANGGSMAKEPMQQELEDIELKLRSAREAAARADATAKDKADVKLIEQEYLAAQQKERRQSSAGDGSRLRLDGKKALDKKLDEALEGTFPGSDPVSFVEAAPVKERDRSLPAVRVAEQQQPEKTKAARKSK